MPPDKNEKKSDPSSEAARDSAPAPVPVDVSAGATDDVAGLAAAAGEDLDHDAHDAHDSQRAFVDEAAASPDEPLEPVPLPVAELAAACVRFVATRYGVALDFKPDTLSLVDQYVQDARAEIAAKPQSLELVQAAAGAYLGEVMRIEYGGMWFADGDHDGWRVDMSRVFLTFNPIGMVREALLLEATEGWHAHLEMDEAEKAEVERRLAALPEVPDAEFYAPTTRFDVVGIAVDALRAQMVLAGLGDVRFTRDDYRR